MEKTYVCTCGQIFVDPQKFNGHKSHCEAHLATKGIDRKVSMQKWIDAGQAASQRSAEKHREEVQQKLNKWISEKHTCGFCGKVMTEFVGTGRFCSKSCSNSYSGYMHYKLENETIEEYIKRKTDKKRIQAKEHLSREEYCLKQKQEHEARYEQWKQNKLNLTGKTIKPFKPDLLEEQNHKCAICGCPDNWQDKPLIFIMDHIDGHCANNLFVNIRLICPNCDSQLDTFKSKNKKSDRSWRRHEWYLNNSETSENNIV